MVSKGARVTYFSILLSVWARTFTWACTLTELLQFGRYSKDRKYNRTIGIWNNKCWKQRILRYTEPSNYKFPSNHHKILQGEQVAIRTPKTSRNSVKDVFLEISTTVQQVHDNSHQLRAKGNKSWLKVWIKHQQEIKRTIYTAFQLRIKFMKVEMKIRCFLDTDDVPSENPFPLARGWTFWKYSSFKNMKFQFSIAFLSKNWREI